MATSHLLNYCLIFEQEEIVVIDAALNHGLIEDVLGIVVYLFTTTTNSSIVSTMTSPYP